MASYGTIAKRYSEVVQASMPRVLGFIGHLPVLLQFSYLQIPIAMFRVPPRASTDKLCHSGFSNAAALGELWTSLRLPILSGSLPVCALGQLFRLLASALGAGQALRWVFPRMRRLLSLQRASCCMESMPGDPRDRKHPVGRKYPGHVLALVRPHTCSSPFQATT